MSAAASPPREGIANPPREGIELDKPCCTKRCADPLSKRKQANDVAFPPSFGGRRVSQRTTPIYAIALSFETSRNSRKLSVGVTSADWIGRARRLPRRAHRERLSACKA